MRRLIDLLFPPRPDEALLRDESADGFLARYAPREAPVSRPHTTALMPLRDATVRAAIHEAKYHGSEAAFTLLAAVLSRHLGELPAEAVIVPVPLGERRRRERGFNQVEEVARRAGGALDTTLLVRLKETESQVSLPRKAREENMRGAFGAAHSPDPALLYIVVDDVVTTGATLQAALDALSAAGARRLHPIALAH